MDMIVQQSVVSQLSKRPDPIQVGPFLIGHDPTTDSRFINYATPRPGEAITAADVADLVAAFRAINRIPRLEYVTSSAADLEQLLLDAGFTVEARHDYLVCTPRTLTTLAVPDGFDLIEPTTDDERAGVIAAQNEAFGGEATATEADVARMRRNQDNGAVTLLARTRDGVIVGGGQASAPAEGVTEVAGIAVREAFRRRGIAGALTAAITARALATGLSAAWLEASGEDSWRVYERVGYAPTGKRLYIALDETENENENSNGN